MKKIFFILFLIPFFSSAQNRVAIDSLKNELNPRNNNKYRLWRLFKNADDSSKLTLTTIGTSGAATYNKATRTFNIPVYTASFPSNAQGFLRNNGTGTLSWTPSDGTGYMYNNGSGSLSYVNLFSSFNNGDVILGNGSSGITSNVNFTFTGRTLNTSGIRIPATSSLTINSATYNDYDIWSVAGVSSGSFFRVQTNGNDVTLTGLVAQSDGYILVLKNFDSAHSIILKQNNSGSSAANRFNFSTGTDITVTFGHSVELMYDATSQIWFDLSSR